MMYRNEYNGNHICIDIITKKYYYTNYMMVCGIHDIIMVCLLFFASAPMCFFARSNSTPPLYFFQTV